MMTHNRVPEGEQIAVPAPVKYSLLRDSQLAKYAGNTATLFSVLDAILNCLRRIEGVNHFLLERVPFFVSGLYYLIPSATPLFPYLRNRWPNQAEVYDPDAFELLDVLREHDNEIDKLVRDNHEEKTRILEVLSSYLKYEKNQPFSIVINLIFLTFRAAHGILLFSEGMNIADKETNDKMGEWANLLSAISNITYLSMVMLHNNFQKYHFSEHKTEVESRSHLLRKTIFKIKAKLGATVVVGNPELSVPLLGGNDVNHAEGESITVRCQKN